MKTLLPVDFGGRSRYSVVRAVRGEEQKSRMVIYPNPGQAGSVEAFINYATPARTVELMDAHSCVLRRWSSVSGLLPIDGLASGMYLPHVSGRNRSDVSTDKILITH